MSYTEYSDDFETEETTEPEVFRTPFLSTSPVEKEERWPDSDEEIKRICGGLDD